MFENWAIFAEVKAYEKKGSNFGSHPVYLVECLLQYAVLRIVFRENYGYSNEYQSVDIKVLLHQNIQCINI